MGVLYHRKNPREHIEQMYALTDDRGKCVMETLVVDAKNSLYPQGRYARMRNIGVIPNLTDLRQWMADAGYQNIELIDLSPTTTKEQRSTPWMRFESLDKSLDPQNASLTVEGLPAPLRAMLIGTR
jgi:tRNA (mo5U34)-methyltransferase